MATNSPITGVPTRAPDIRTAVRRFLSKNEIAASRFGRDALRDPAFVRDLMHNGRQPRPETCERVLDFIASREGC